MLKYWGERQRRVTSTPEEYCSCQKINKMKTIAVQIGRMKAVKAVLLFTLPPHTVTCPLICISLKRASFTRTNVRCRHVAVLKCIQGLG